jgi:hypothetical protein
MKGNPRITDTHVYFPAALYGKLKRLSKRERHTISVEIVIAVENHVDVMSRRKPDPPSKAG